MDFGKLSETFRGIAGHLSGFVDKGVTVGEEIGKIDTVAVHFAKMFQAMLDGMAGVLEASPVTLPGPKITPPGGK